MAVCTCTRINKGATEFIHIDCKEIVLHESGLLVQQVGRSARWGGRLLLMLRGITGLLLGVAGLLRGVLVLLLSC